MQEAKVCFITGASSGFGEGFALRFAREGYAVGLSARREDRLEEVAEKVRAAGGTVGVFPSDVADRMQVLEAIRRCETELGPVDLLIANAGLSILTLVEEFNVEEVEYLLRVNLLGAIYATEGVLPGMLERSGGQIAVISSLAGLGGLPKSAAYSASKAGMINFFESLRVDLKPKGIYVTVITPGFVKTPMTDHNRHSMPFLMDLDPALDRMVRAIIRRKKFLAYPRPLAAIAWGARVLPRGVYDAIAGRIKRDKEPQSIGRSPHPS